MHGSTHIIPNTPNRWGNAGNPILWTDCRLTDLGTPPSKSVTVEINWFGDSVEVRGVPGMLSMGGHSAEASSVIDRSR